VLQNKLELIKIKNTYWLLKTVFIIKKSRHIVHFQTSNKLLLRNKFVTKLFPCQEKCSQGATILVNLFKLSKFYHIYLLTNSTRSRHGNSFMNSVLPFWVREYAAWQFFSFTTSEVSTFWHSLYQLPYINYMWSNNRLQPTLYGFYWRITATSFSPFGSSSGCVLILLLQNLYIYK
jgi:hypothetical protein